MMTKKNMDWKIWGKKVGLTALSVLIVGGASVWTNNPWWLMALPVLKGIENWWKHK